MSASKPVRPHDCLGGDEGPCEKPGTEEREVGGLICHLCAAHTAEFDTDTDTDTDTGGGTMMTTTTTTTTIETVTRAQLWQVEGRDESGNWDTYAVGGPEVARFEEEPSEEQLVELARCLGCPRSDVRAVEVASLAAEEDVRAVEVPEPSCYGACRGCSCGGPDCDATGCVALGHCSCAVEVSS